MRSNRVGASTAKYEVGKDPSFNWFAGRHCSPMKEYSTLTALEKISLLDP